MVCRQYSTRCAFAALVLMSFVLTPSEESSPPCSAYEVLIINAKTCVARCPLSCGGGICYTDNTCACQDGYSPSVGKGYLCTSDCVDGCKRAGGICAAPNLCVCPKGTQFNTTLKKCIWRPKWLDPCKGRCRYGSCSSDGTCTCAESYIYNATATNSDQLCYPRCWKNCGPNAYCYLPDMCACSERNSHYNANGICTPQKFNLPGHLPLHLHV